jgi:hypothetical protein
VFRCGQVIEIFDPWTRPPKQKWHICVCDQRYLFLRISPRPLWPPHHVLLQDGNPFLEHDSYVELRQLYHFSRRAVTAALRLSKNPIGVLSADEALALAMAARRAPTLSQENSDIIWQNLAPLLGP